ncbi:MAG TPA: hypothetical protein VGO02_09845 [Burkholderiales bacterium]|jgi:hypothetical protein|nr:hypothetical protein [Burkholderiales bacterium]
MRTAIIIAVGFLLWGLCLGIAKLTSNLTAPSATVATAAFVVLWFIAAAVNMWVGVAKAGYSFMEELPIFLVIFLVPCAVAVAVKWRFL